ncbi:MAG: hypothetical protein GC134_05960 [Proteobacteria bacterium]|nr:hypothetical protein [Pseudomonadota bacterium]
MDGILSALMGFLLSEAGLYTIISVLALVLVGWAIRSVSNALKNRNEKKRKARIIDARLDPLVKAVTDAGAKRERGPSPDLTPLRDAAAALVAEIDAVRIDILKEVTGVKPAEPAKPADKPAEEPAPAAEAPAEPRKPQVFPVDADGKVVTDETEKTD